MSLFDNVYSIYSRGDFFYRKIFLDYDYDHDESEYYDRFKVSLTNVVAWNDDPIRWVIDTGVIDDVISRQNFIIAFMSQSRVVPLGANLLTVAGVNTVELLSLLPEDDPHELPTREKFRCHAYHSAQYRSTMALRYKFWAHIAKEYLDVTVEKVLSGE